MGDGASDGMRETVVVTVCSLDAVLRDIVVGGLLCDLPDTVAVGYDVDAGGVLLSWVIEQTGVPERDVQRLGRDCTSCSIGVDLAVRVTGLWRVASRVRPRVVVLALPPAVEPTFVHGFLPRGWRFGPVIAALDGAGLAEDALGDDLLAERGIALSEGDRRGVGEVVAHHLEAAHLLATPEMFSSRARLLVNHLAGPVPDARLCDGVEVLEVERPVRQRPRGRAALQAAAPTGAPDHGGVWTLDLDSWRPLHPDRLREGIDVLGQGRTRGRGRFWLATRPLSVLGWEGAGGQLGIGAIGLHSDHVPRSRLVITGVDGDPDLHRTAFQRALLTNEEISRGPSWWAGRDDGFTPWLGAEPESSTPVGPQATVVTSGGPVSNALSGGGVPAGARQEGDR